ncbi:N-acetylmuramoyl-L-alanine amidase [Streptomyces sp. NPDC001530]|uniref:peptidoglycan recognition protein family protein n=1 Tax=Streptomyces sp. NPDC001530 TaxID=3364582 RepID=UPI0036B9AC48
MRGFLASSAGVTCAAALALPLALPTPAQAGPAMTSEPTAPGSTQSLPLTPLPGERTPGSAVPDQGLTQRDVRPFSLVGVIWDNPDSELRGRVQVRTRAVGTGHWSDWQDVETHNHEHAADPDTAEGESGRVHGSTAPLWVGNSDGVEARVQADERATAPGDSPLPKGLHLELVDPGADPPRTGAGRAATGEGAPAARTREAAPAGNARATTPTDAPTADALRDDPTTGMPAGDLTAGMLMDDPTAGMLMGDPTADMPEAGPADDTPVDAPLIDAQAAAPLTEAQADAPRTDGQADAPRTDGQADAPQEGALSDESAAASAANADLAPLGALEIPALSKKETEREFLAAHEDEQRAKPYIGARPRIITRRSWGADESLREGGFVYTKKVKAAFVHHTASGNNYSCSQAPSVIRSIYRYHVVSSGWRDIGYNFLVDKCGNIYEGRAGGVTKPVMGAHTRGFNSDSMGIAVLGSFGKTKPSGDAVTAIARLTAWKLGLFGANPRGKTYLKSGGGNLYRKGKNVRLNVISGHRDGFATDCPGRLLYGKLGTARQAAARYQGR